MKRVFFLIISLFFVLFKMASADLVDFENLDHLYHTTPVPIIDIVSFENAVIARGGYGFIGGGPMSAAGNTYITHTGSYGSPESIKWLNIYFASPVTNLSFEIADIDASFPATYTIERAVATVYDDQNQFLGSIAIDASMAGTGNGIVTLFDFGALGNISVLKLTLDNIGTVPDAIGYGWGIDNIYYDLDLINTVTIDIMPEQYPNLLDHNSKGLVNVAMFGSSNFNIYDVDQASLLFNGLSVFVISKDEIKCFERDINLDEYVDLVCQFRTHPSVWDVSVTEATLTGEFFDGTLFEGTDTIIVQ
jgi:hypothetical protein